MSIELRSSKNVSNTLDKVAGACPKEIYEKGQYVMSWWLLTEKKMEALAQAIFLLFDLVYAVERTSAFKLMSISPISEHVLA